MTPHAASVVRSPVTAPPDVDRVATAANDRPARFVSIVVPCLNEELVIGEFVDWARAGLAKAGVEGEVLIIDSSADRSPEIAEAHGARVLRVPKRGLGQAYLDAIPHIRGNYIIMGDADLTYDFREVAAFIEKLDVGAEFVMGSRMKGRIEPGAMPPLHQYFGTPVTTMILNAIYRSHFSDIHCGMRGMTYAALQKIDLQSTSWEYASEMVLKSVCTGLRTAEVPIKFYKDRDGRESHHKRSGWLSPWKAGWMNLRVMFVFAPDFFLLWPSILMITLGLTLLIGLLRGPVSIGGVMFNLHWMLLGLTITMLGHNGLHLALLSKAYHNFKPATTRRILHFLSYDRGMIGGSVLIIAGFVMNLALLIQWLSRDLKLAAISHGGVFGLMLIMLGFQTLTHTLILQMVLFSRRSKAAA